METILEEIKGNRLRIIKFLYRNEKGSTFATRGNIVSMFYLSNTFIEKEAKPDDDINFLISKNLIEREGKDLWLTDSAIKQFSEYLKTETDLILRI